MVGTFGVGLMHVACMDRVVSGIEHGCGLYRPYRFAFTSILVKGRVVRPLFGFGTTGNSLLERFVKSKSTVDRELASAVNVLVCL